MLLGYGQGYGKCAIGYGRKRWSLFLTLAINSLKIKENKSLAEMEC